MAEIPPLNATPLAPGSISFVGPSPWITTRDDDASYIAKIGDNGASLDFPDLGADKALTFVTRLRGLTATAAGWRWVNLYDDTQTISIIFDAVSTTWHEQTIASTFRTPAAGGPFSVNFNMASHGDDDWRITYFAVVVRTGLPPLRQFPRDDEHGSAARVWPVSSEQASIRRLGGYH